MKYILLTYVLPFLITCIMLISNEYRLYKKNKMDYNSLINGILLLIMGLILLIIGQLIFKTLL